MNTRFSFAPSPTTTLPIPGLKPQQKLPQNAKDQIMQEAIAKSEFASYRWLEFGTTQDHAKRIHELLVQAQTEEHEKPNTLFNLVIQGDLAGIRERLENERKYNDGAVQLDAELVKKTDAAGGNVIHAAYLYQKYHIGRWLVENYPHIAILPFTDECKRSFGLSINSQDMPYTGENILHMTIVRKNLAETRWILDFYKEHKDSVPNGLETLLLGNAVGKFFDRGGDFYCGSYPLHFAACSNDPLLFDLILSYASVLRSGSDEFQNETARLGPNVIFMRDANGNNCLHLAVIHRLNKMYSHIKTTAYNFIHREIQLAYAERLQSEDFDSIISLSPLPTNLEGFRCGYCPKETDIIAPQDRLSTEAHAGWLSEVAAKKIQERMELVLNEEYHSPLTLCGASAKGSEKQEERKREMISFLIAQMKQDRWNYGPINCSLLRLEGVEYPYYLENYQVYERQLPQEAFTKMHGLIEWICITEASTCAELPEIKKIISAKWQRFGYDIFIRQFAFRIVLTLLLTILLCFANATPSYNKGMNESMTSTVSVLYPVVLVMCSFAAIYEIPSVVSFGLDYWGILSRRVRGAAKFEKMSNTLMLLSFLSLIVNEYVRYIDLKLGRPTDLHGDLGVKISFTVCIMSVWLYLFYFFMGFDRTGPFVLTLYHIVSRDIPFFASFYLIVVAAFGCALSLYTNNGNKTMTYGFQHVAMTIFDLIQITVQMQQSGNYNPEVDKNNVPSDLVWIFNIFFTAFYILVVLMFLNLLIAMINNTYSRLIVHDDAFLLIEKYNIMSALENSIWFINRRSLPQNYSVVVHGKVGVSQITNLVVEQELVNVPTFQRKFTVDDLGLDLDQQNERDYNELFLERQDDRHYAFEMLDEDKSWWGGKQKLALTANGSQVRKKTTLLLIMPQNDFHEEYGVKGTPGYRKAGSLAVPGSNDDSFRIKDMIMKNLDKIDDIIVTMDSHYPTHIAHAIFWRRGWKNPDPYNPNQHPDPFTVITHKDIVEEVWSPVMKDEYVLAWVLYYTRELEKKGRLQLTIWPEHCILGSSGHAVVTPINDALQVWAQNRCKSVKYVLKGQNLYTEMYSVLAAEVEDPADPATGMDFDLLAELKIADRVLVCGQALSHCVNFTFMDILKYWQSDNAKLHILRNGCSSVKGFEAVGEKFLAEVKKQGVTVLNCEELKL